MCRAYVIFALLTAAGCATTRAHDPGEGNKAGEQAPRMIIEVKTGKVVDRSAAADRLATVRHVYVGEYHASRVHHLVQMDVLKTLYARGVNLAIGIEWLPAGVQPILNDWVLGRMSESQLFTRVKWRKNWGFDVSHYAPFFRWARDHNVPIWALNSPRRLVRAVRRKGPCQVPAELKPLLPPLDTGNSSHRAFFDEMMSGHPHHSPHTPPPVKHAIACPYGKMSLADRYYLAQLVWDESMSRNLVTHLQSAAGQGKTAVVFAGAAHIVHGHGIPLRARALLHAPFQIVLPVSSGSLPGKHALGPQDYPQKKADFLWEAPPKHRQASANGARQLR